MEKFKTEQGELEALRAFVRSVAAIDLEDDDLEWQGEHDLFCGVQADAQELARRREKGDMTKERQANQPVNATSSDDDIRDRARELHERDGELEIDIDAEVKSYEDGAYVQAWVWVPFEEEEEDRAFYFAMSSAVHGTEEFGPYSSEQEADDGIDRVRSEARKLNDGIRREFSTPYQKTEEEGESTCAHQDNEDCMTCVGCGVCTESLDESDTCPDCLAEEAEADA